MIFGQKIITNLNVYKPIIITEHFFILVTKNNESPIQQIQTIAEKTLEIKFKKSAESISFETPFCPKEGKRMFGITSFEYNSSFKTPIEINIIERSPPLQKKENIFL